jgi:hypothetical protein
LGEPRDDSSVRLVGSGSKVDALHRSRDALYKIIDYWEVGKIGRLSNDQPLYRAATGEGIQAPGRGGRSLDQLAGLPQLQDPGEVLKNPTQSQTHTDIGHYSYRSRFQSGAKACSGSNVLGYAKSP